MNISNNIKILPSEENLLAAMDRVQPFIHNTPVLQSSLINVELENDILFKCENFQKAGSFKIRGAINAIQQLSEEEKTKGVITHSSGNFAQALSLAARLSGVPAYIVMPQNAPTVKVNAVKGYGGQVTFSGNGILDREELCSEMASDSGATFIHPSDNLDVILGQGTAAVELFEQHNDIDYLFVPVGGGGLIGGCSLATYYLSNGTKCYGGEPLEAPDAKQSFDSGIIVKPENPNTIADGLRTYLGQRNFPIILHCVEDIILVTEEDILYHLKLIWERLKIVVEPSSAVALAALTKSGIKGKKIAVLLSGGNVDLNKLPF